MTKPRMHAKMRITNVQQGSSVETLEFTAVGPKGSYPADGSDENNTFARWTPQARLTMTITNPALLGCFDRDDVFYVDFTPAEKA